MQLSARDLAIGSLPEAFWKADGWRRLGYATESQYARERLGMSLSSIKEKRGLARRAEKMPRLSTALEKGELGYEAARLVASVATSDTVEAWIRRASERTVRFLREEVDAVRMFERLAPGALMSPPSEAIMQEVADLESRVVSGAVFREVEQSQMSAGSGSGERFEAFEGVRRRSRAARARAHEFFAVFVLFADWGLEAHARLGRRVRGRLRSRSLSLYESGVRAASRDSAPS